MLVILALGVPVGSSLYWIFEGGAHAITGVTVTTATLTTVGYGIAAAGVDTVLALPLALLALRHQGRIHHLLERSTYLVLAMPGVVAAFALSYFTPHYLKGFAYQNAPLLIGCYAIMFFPWRSSGSRHPWPVPPRTWTTWPAPWARVGSPSCCG